MIVVDTSVWVDHLRLGDAHLADRLAHGRVGIHPFVLGEIACGTLADRTMVLELLGELPTPHVAESAEVLGFIERYGLAGKRIGYVDVHLLAAVALTPGASLWTRDKRLHLAACSLDRAYRDAPAH